MMAGRSDLLSFLLSWAASLPSPPLLSLWYLQVVSAISVHRMMLRLRRYIPKSMPMTWPLTFSSPPSAYPLMNDEPRGDLTAGERRKAEDARGSSCERINMSPDECKGHRSRTFFDSREDNMVAAERSSANEERVAQGMRNWRAEKNC